MVHRVGGFVYDLCRAFDRKAGPLLHGRAIDVLLGMLIGDSYVSDEHSLGEL